MVRLAANLGFLWPELPLLERIKSAARAGFRAVEFHWPYDVDAHDIRRTCSENDIRPLGINTAAGDRSAGEFGLAALPGREAEFQRSIDEAIAYCHTCGATAIHAMAGNVTPDQRPLARKTLLKNLKAAAERAAAHGITLLLEPLNAREYPFYAYSTAGEAVEVIGELNLRNVRLQFDIYHVAISEGDVVTKLRRYLPLIGHVQIAGVPGRAEPDDGEIAYGFIFRELDALGYSGWIGCEYRPRGSTDAGLEWIERLEAAAKSPSEQRL